MTEIHMPPLHQLKASSPFPALAFPAKLQKGEEEQSFLLLLLLLRAICSAQLVMIGGLYKPWPQWRRGGRA
eukprot:3836920-Amphidinium_carterae.1